MALLPDIKVMYVYVCMLRNYRSNRLTFQTRFNTVLPPVHSLADRCRRHLYFVDVHKATASLYTIETNCCSASHLNSEAS